MRDSDKTFNPQPDPPGATADSDSQAYPPGPTADFNPQPDPPGVSEGSSSPAYPPGPTDA